MIGRVLPAGAVVVLAGGLAACGGSSGGTTPSGGGTCGVGSAGVNQGTPSTAVQATDSLTFLPQNITVGVGQVVQWKNTGQIMHTVTFNSGSASCLTDPSLNGSAPWDVTFSQAGTYAYHCAIHEQMTGIVTVH
jgi:plastocyanin